MNRHKLQAFFTDFAASQENGEFRIEDLDSSTAIFIRKEMRV